MSPDELRTQTCRVVTHGRGSGTEHVVQVWFVIIDGRFYAASRNGIHGDWLQNALHYGSLEIRAAHHSWHGPTALAGADEIPDVLEAFAEKYRKYHSVVDAWEADPPVFVRADLA